MNDGMRFAAFGLGACAVVAAFSGNAQAVTLDKVALGCQKTIGKAALGLKASYTKAFAGYLNAELKAPGTGDVAKRDAAITKAEGKFDAAIAKKCDPAVIGSDVLSPPPPAGIGFPAGTCGALWGEAAPEEAYEQACAALPTSTIAQKNACWRCFIKGELREWLKAHYPWVQGLVPAGSDLCGTPPVVSLPPDKATLKCLTTIPKLANALLVGTEKSTEACLNSVRQGKITGPCPDAKGVAAIQKLKDKLTDGAVKACPAFPLWWDQCFEGTCPGTPISSVATISSCTNGAGIEVPNEITCAMYPGANADGVSCPPADSGAVCGDGINSPGEPCDASAPSAGWNTCGSDFTCVACNCGCPTTVTFATNASDAATVLDSGWTGISHRSPVISNGEVTVHLACPGGGTSRPCGTCTVSGPFANPHAGAGQLDSQRCTNDTSIRCTTNAPCIGGGGTCQFFFGSDLPLAAGGVTTCVVNQFNGSVSGTANVETGDAVNSAALTARVYNGLAIDNPCARCIGDTTINDGVQGGTCSGGTRNGLACDANGAVPGRPDYGQTSLDCPLATGALIATLPIDLSNATEPVVKTVTASSPSCSGEPGEKCLCDTCNNINQEPCDANSDCPDPPGPIGPICGGKRCIGGTNNGAACTSNTECPAGGLCQKPGEPTKPSACLDDTNTVNTLDCSDTAPVDGEGECTGGPVTTHCSVGSGHAQRGCITDADCGGGAGSCVAENRLCFLTGTSTGTGKVGTQTLIANGMADTPMHDTSTPTLGAVFCIGPTGSSSVNNVAGLPGPGRVTIRGTAVAHP